jgi:hypothetical protein
VKATKALVALSALFALLVEAHGQATNHWGPYVLGYETEPAMDFGGRFISSMDIAICDAGSALLSTKPALAAAYEVPVGLLLETAQHEVFGHGSRAREFSLDPQYGMGFDMSAYTSVNRAPETTEQLILLAGGGTEADTVLADNLKNALCTRRVPASIIPMLLFAKLDLSVYCWSTSDPSDGASASDSDDFGDQFENGNDIANYLVARQGQRNGADLTPMYNQEQSIIDYEDPLLAKNYDAAQAAALWNALDPMLWASMVLYVNDHLVHGRRCITQPVLPLGDRFGLGLGTRASLDPESISRYLDVYLTYDQTAVRLYGRHMDSSTDTAYGCGISLVGLPLGGPIRISAGADSWGNPKSDENLYDGRSWNAFGEFSVDITESVQIVAKIGRKSAGFLPGTPEDGGTYVGGGLGMQF